MPWIFNKRTQDGREEAQMFDMQRIGAFIAMCRKERGLTQNELAQHMGVSFQAVSNWERGTAMPDISKLEQLSNLLQITPEELLRGRRMEPVQGEHDADIVAASAQPEDQAAQPQQKTKREIAQPKPADEAGEPEVHADNEIDLEQLVSIAPCVSTELVDAYAARAVLDPEDFSIILSLAPFMSKQALTQLVERYVRSAQEAGAGDGIDLQQLVSIVPFISTELVDAYAARAVHSPEDFSIISSLAPFMSKQALTQLVGQYIHSAQELQYLRPLAPFLDQSWLDDVFLKQFE
mgnify:FL=1